MEVLSMSPTPLQRSTQGQFMMRFFGMSLGMLLAANVVSHTLAADWQPSKGPLMTRWAAHVSPGRSHPEYPRPQMRRNTWKNLNGLWEYAIRPKAETEPEAMDGKILVPFPVESALSGVMQPVGESKRLWYRRTFCVPKAWKHCRVLLHFGAVDWDATVMLNGKPLGQHRGGYDPFSFDITNSLKPDGDQELVLSVWDPNDSSFQPRGKQVNKPGGIFYTPSTGIWQTVWLEAVPQTYIRSLQVTPNVAKQNVEIEVDAVGLCPQDSLRAVARGGACVFASSAACDNKITMAVPNAVLWSPNHPFLYDLSVCICRGNQPVDAVKSYFAMRKISLGKDEAGIVRLMLNDKPLFQVGPLDQGFWPDGLYTAPTDEAMRYDIQVTKDLGFNMIRKHVKVEPARWYAACDEIGILVWQDMPSGDQSIGGNDPDLRRSLESAQQFETEWTNIIAANRHFPSIVMWVPFNEGWGQFDTARIVEFTRQLDPTRLVNCASGWTDRGVGDVHDMHSYPGPGMFPVESERASVLGEFGGLGLPLEGHTWQSKDNWGYKSFTTKEDLTAAYLQLISKLRPLIGKGLSAAVYTQTTDVEVEVNGLLTYDRAVLKMPAQEIAAANATLFLPPPKVHVIAPTSQHSPQEWRFTTSSPSADWYQPEFDAASWTKGPGGLGSKETPGTVVRAVWKSPEIWARRQFDMTSVPRGDVQLAIHHDEDAQVYINGVLAADLHGYTSDYTLATIRPEARAALKTGKNLIAVYCKQTSGGQYIDVGLSEVVEQGQ